ncbi:MAG: radical SAM protein [Magnetococcales bacterium]|nr:radical SAM protein [Magnetococcales bacterium]
MAHTTPPSPTPGKKVMLFYPPGPLYQRGEDRSQGNVTDSTATAMRAANDLAYASAALKAKGFDVYCRDFQTEGVDWATLLHSYRGYKPDVLFISITNATIFADLQTVKKLKEADPRPVVILKGALFFDPPAEMLAQLDLTDVAYLIGGEADFVVGELVDAHFTAPERIPRLRGILYRQDGQWQRGDFSSWEADLDQWPFPDRTVLNNSLYVRPDTGEPQATIATSRGCPAACIYCLTPTISGTTVRYRSPANILEELRLCYHDHGIRNFFFKSDTFTINRGWVAGICDAIDQSELAGNIEWVANSRVRPLAGETLQRMRRSGCWLIAFGFESGSEETLQKIHKGASVAENLAAARLARQAGLKLYGFYLIGLPWEDHTHLEETRKHIFAIDADFIEVHIAVPYHGTALYEMAKAEGLLDETILGKDYFNAPTIGSRHLSNREIQAFRRRLLRAYHLRPAYIARKLAEVFKKPRIMKNYLRFGSRLLLRTLP